jgi:hypothetical protein
MLVERRYNSSHRPVTLDLHLVKKIKESNFVMIKRDKNNKFKKKGNRSATCRPAKGKLMSLFRAGWLFPEVKNLNKNLIRMVIGTKPGVWTGC